MLEIIFFVVAHPAFSDSSPAMILHTLTAADALPRFTRKYGKSEGDCHEIAVALILDLLDQKPDVPFKWHWYVGDCPHIGEHSWIECEGWAIDASNGHQHPVIIQRADDYREGIAAANIAEGIKRPPVAVPFELLAPIWFESVAQP